MKTKLLLLFTISLIASCVSPNIKKVEESTKIPVMVSEYKVDSTEASYSLLKFEKNTYLINTKTKDVEFIIQNERATGVLVFLFIVVIILILALSLMII